MITFIPHWLKDNFRIKISLFCLAILLWFLVVTEKTYDYIAEVPLMTTHVKAGKMVTNKIPEVALVKFRATGKELLKLIFFSEPSLQVNLSTISLRYTFDIKTDMVAVPAGVTATVVNVLTPDSLEIILDEIFEKEVSVNSNITIKTAPGYIMVGDITLNPSKVKIIGPKGKLLKINSIDSDSTFFIDAKRNTVMKLKLKDLDIAGYRIEPKVVTASVHIEKIGERKIKGIAVKVKNQPANRDIILEPGTVDVLISGAITVISDFKNEDLAATADYRSYNPRRSHRVQVKLEVNSTIDVIEILPKDVRMIVRRK